MYKKFLKSDGSLNANMTRKMTEDEILQIRTASNVHTTTINTALYCLHNNVACKTCDTCGAELPVENFIAGWNVNKRFCSIKCKATFDYTKVHGNILLNYAEVLDINGNPASSKLDRLMNIDTIEDLQNKTGIIISDVNTLLYAALNEDFIPYRCKTCSTLLPIDSFQIPYRDKQQFCSIVCKDVNEEYRNNLSLSKIGKSRYDSVAYVTNHMLPWYNERIKSLSEDYDVKTYTDLEEYMQDKTKIRFNCMHCNFDFVSNFSNNGRIPKCPKCKSRSKQQIELSKFVESFGFKITIDDMSIISPKQIDIYIPELNIGIEYDGFYWHDDKDDTEKYNIAELAGIRIIRVFEDEYKFKKQIVLSRIANILGKVNNKIYARNCTVSEISNEIASPFLTENHIQGNVNSQIKLGLYNDTNLVAVMSFGASRYDKSIQYELLRFASEMDTTVIGGASKLFSHFIKSYDPQSVISYCDVRYGTGKMYETLGFVHSHTSKSNYFYYKKNKRYSRVSFQKHKLEDILEFYDESLSESANMSKNGYLRIYDNGNKVYKWAK